jgi:molecular chaperone GrpE
VNKGKKGKLEESDKTTHESQKEETKAEEMNEEKEIEQDDQKISELESQVKELEDRLLRKVAEFENFKRRTENDQFNLLTYGAESFIVKLLPVIDDFERSLQHIDSADDSESIKKGIKLVYDKLMKMLEEQGVSKMESVGKSFNVDYHDALMQRKDENSDPHTVLEEIEPGYVYREKVIRHAKVIVSEDLSEDNVQSKDSDSNDAVNKKEN